MKVFSAIVFLAALAAFYVTAGLLCGDWGFPTQECVFVSGFDDYYSKNLRGHLFSAFLGLAGFLLALKTFTVVTMKEQVYDKLYYRERVEERRKLNAEIEHWLPLSQLNDALFYAIVFGVIASALQITLGLVTAWWASVVCISSAIIALASLARALIYVKSNFDVWFEDLHHQEAQKR